MQVLLAIYLLKFTLVRFRQHEMAGSHKQHGSAEPACLNEATAAS
jgi:hypothetical protein